MKKSDLRTGMVIKTRNGDRYLVLRDGEELIFMSADSIGHNNDDGLEEDMLYPNDNDFDIMRVFDKVFTFNNVKVTNRLLWEREEVKKMTLAEIEISLGYKVEVIAG